ncbi:hypothetical protein DNTS_017214 [Danionella cerebrum]|uniref:Glycosyltransferase 2-like domain-containing protein n=1 Tax=Danionella cerebrum TaxID=2873325 RepID=A0A553QBP4_9TELE|nr:hypothetical protein DNTS_017214 [Danionella translucida]
MSGSHKSSGESERESKRLCTWNDAECEKPAEGACAPVCVSVIMPVFNASDWLDECLQSILEQDFQGSMELCVFDDSSTDGSRALDAVSEHMAEGITSSSLTRPESTIMVDDVMKPQRVRLQLEAAEAHPDAIVGCRVCRVPDGSTERYTRWINSLSPEQLLTQVFTSHGPTAIMPTWFCSRRWFLRVGAFDERGKGVPEDLLFFYQSLRCGGGVVRVDEETIWDLRVCFLQERVLSQWESFTIWNSGKQGRKLYRSLTPGNQSKVPGYPSNQTHHTSVKAFCDVDEKKIQKGFYTYEESAKRPKPKVPVLHFREASPPFIICVKLDMSDGVFEENLQSLELTEGVHYFHFN